MKKILVTTDFSVNSRAALRFAIHLATTTDVKLTFFHSCYFMKPFAWSASQFDEYEKEEFKKLEVRLHGMVHSIYKQFNITPASVDCIVKSSMVTDSNIAKYAADNHFDFICISRSGEGKISDFLFGTNTTNLIDHAEVPIIAVPNNYQAKLMMSILYASDFSDVTPEIEQVASIARFLKLKVDMVHLKKMFETEYDKEKFTKWVSEEFDFDINFSTPDYLNDFSFPENLGKAVKRLQSSAIVMFAHTDKSLIDKIFFDTHSTDTAVYSKVPLFIFKKGNNTKRSEITEHKVEKLYALK